MAEYIIKNEQLTLTVDTAGAELVSVKSAAGREYLFDADPKYWKRHSPVLFPFVGGVRGKEYRYQGVSYPMGQHGFARDMEFTFLSETETEAGKEIWFCLAADEETKKKYPFDFVLRIGYRLKDNQVTALWEVENQGTADMPFSIGAHPAFYCPKKPAAGETPDPAPRTEYELRFDTKEPISFYLLKDGLAVPEVTETLAQSETGAAPLVEGIFDRDALIVAGNQAHQVSLAKKGEEPYVTVDFDAPLFGLWSPPGTDVPFVCIEPWFGRCDAHDFTGTLEEREYGQLAAPGETKAYSYRMTFA